MVSPPTPASDQCQNSPAASQEIWHHTVWRTWLFIAYSDEKWLYYKFSLHHSYNRFLKGWGNTLFELRSERVNPFTPKSDQVQISPVASPSKITSHSKENVAFHSLLRWKTIILPILTTSRTFLLKRCFELGSERANSKLKTHSPCVCLHVKELTYASQQMPSAIGSTLARFWAVYCKVVSVYQQW